MVTKQAADRPLTPGSERNRRHSAPKKESGDPRQIAGRPTYDMQGSRKGIHTISCVRENVKLENEKS